MCGASIFDTSSPLDDLWNTINLSYMGVLNHHVDACNKYQHTDFSFSFYFLFCTTTPTRRPPQHLASAAADIRATPPTFAALARPPLTPIEEESSAQSSLPPISARLSPTIHSAAPHHLARHPFSRHHHQADHSPRLHPPSKIAGH